MRKRQRKKELQKARVLTGLISVADGARIVARMLAEFEWATQRCVESVRRLPRKVAA